MRSLLLTQADTRAELERDFALWQAHHGAPPDLIVGPLELPFSVDQADGAAEDSTFGGVRVVTLAELCSLYRDMLPDDEDGAETGGGG